jgi:choline-sulfatase
MRILYIDCDTLRADHLGCYGYCRDTSPNIDRIAGEGVRFENCYVSDAPCLPSRAALHTGRFGIQSGVVNHGGECADLRLEGRSRGFKTNSKHWMDQLRRAGYSTVSVSPFAERHSAWWFYAGFNECHNTGKSGQERADEIYPVAAKWLEENADDDNWFMQVNFWDPHTPYRTPLEYGNPFEGLAFDEFLSAEDISRDYASYGPHSAQDTAHLGPNDTERFPRLPKNIANPDDYRKWIDGYDVGIRYMDDYIGKLVALLEQQGVLDDTAIILSSDHGEAQGELGVYGDHHFADHTTSRIPLIVRWPGLTSERVNQGLIYQMDLAPTVCELAGGEAHPGWQSQSFAKALKSGKDWGRDELVVSMGVWSCNRSVRWDKWLMMRVWDDGMKPVPEFMLFDLEADPHQMNNLAAEKPEVLNAGLARLERWTSAQLASSPSPVDPMQIVISEGGPYHTRDELQDYCKYLRKTDRAGCAEELEAKAAARKRGAYVDPGSA